MTSKADDLIEEARRAHSEASTIAEMVRSNFPVGGRRQQVKALLALAIAHEVTDELTKTYQHLSDLMDPPRTKDMNTTIRTALRYLLPAVHQPRREMPPSPDTLNAFATALADDLPNLGDRLRLLEQVTEADEQSEVRWPVYLGLDYVLLTKVESAQRFYTRSATEHAAIERLDVPGQGTHDRAKQLHSRALGKYIARRLCLLSSLVTYAVYSERTAERSHCHRQSVVEMVCGDIVGAMVRSHTICQEAVVDLALVLASIESYRITVLNARYAQLMSDTTGISVSDS